MSTFVEKSNDSMKMLLMDDDDVEQRKESSEIETYLNE